MRAPLILLLLLAGCGHDSPLSETGRLLGLGTGQETDRLAIAEAESGEDSDRPQLRLALGRRSASATLLQQQGDRRLWRAPGGVVIATDGPRVVATAGLPQIVMATRIDGTDPLDDARPLLERSAEARRLVDIAGASRAPETMRFGLAFDCRLRGDLTEEGLILVVERCRIPGLSPVTNRFWASPETGQVNFAEQWVGPGMGPLSLDFGP
ncbi:YjbF family lipoprotein [Roseococcus pinisoli]|uniref:YjbF family lipoprotein n=1 Tax=Roseococcus pinisoli TaxID=2835040 RepID=A0ABS5Q7Z8_9PROT|nr:YjbF family lipoprotein [Roseococcus pinisoli]MBS7809796.1 YjbF family lipoprotein [Roseococcus pinisoli]